MMVESRVENLISTSVVIIGKMGQLNNLQVETPVVTSSYITNDGMPILYVSNDPGEEGGSVWQFHCGNGDYNMDKMLLVRLDTILKIDPELGKLVLEIGEEAKRTSESNWIIRKQ